MEDTFSREQVSKITEELHRVMDDVAQLKAGRLRVGTIIRTGVGSYDFLVAISGVGNRTCTLARTAQGSPFGYADCDMPKEGSVVVVMLNADSSGLGYILGTLDTRAFNLEKDKKPEDRLKQLLTLFEGPNTNTELIYSDPIEKNDGTSFWAGNHRPGDVFPGDFVRLNEYGVGLDGDTLTMSLRGGQARVSASIVDNCVEIVSKNFRQYDISGFKKAFLDGGYITEEAFFAPYLGERKGGYGIKAERPDDEDENRPVGKYRLRTYKGYLGGIISSFLSRSPDCDKDDSKTLRTTADKEPDDLGLMQLHINDNGRLLYRSAGGFALERSDMIPVPIRIREFDDPEGIDSADIERKDVVKFVKPKDSDEKSSGHYDAIALADRMVHEYKQSYARFLEYVEKSGSSSDNDEFYLKEVKDLDPLQDESGTSAKSIKEDNLEENVGRKAGVYCLPSGAIIIRDAWGSEIVMEGGSITISACGNINIQPGRSFVAMAGDDAVVKALKSVDILASDNDVTIHADCNVRIAAGSDDTEDRGSIVLESFSKQKVKGSSNKGEEYDGTGIVIKAKDSGVAILADDASVYSKTTTSIVSDNLVMIDGDRAGMSAANGIMLSGSGCGAMFNGGTAAIVGDTAIVSGSGGVVFTTSGQVGVPIWLDFGQDYSSRFTSYLEKFATASNKIFTSSPLSPTSTISKSLFSFRSSKECGTAKSSDITDRFGKFMLYQPYWSVLVENEIYPLVEDLKGKSGDKNLSLSEWGEDHPVDGRYPWPGTSAVKDGKYAHLKKFKDPTLNQIKIERKIKEGTKDKTVSMLCDNEYDNIDIEEERDEYMIELDPLSDFVVPVLHPDDDEDDSKSKNKKK